MLRRIWAAPVSPASSLLSPQLPIRRRQLSCLAATAAKAPLRAGAAAAAPPRTVTAAVVPSPWNLAGSLRAPPPPPSLLLPRLASPSLLQLRTFASKKHKNLLRYAKGYRGRSKNCFRIAVRRVEKAWQYAYRDRRRRKRAWRRLWIMRLQAAVRQYGYGYAQLVPALRGSRVALNRKVLAEVATNEPFAFYAVLRALEATNAGLQARRDGGVGADGEGAARERMAA